MVHYNRSIDSSLGITVNCTNATSGSRKECSSIFIRRTTKLENLKLELLTSTIS